ncbi:MAG: TraR/DksA family transcriptional regulator, partial [bacterium JZ-2024 1]
HELEKVIAVLSLVEEQISSLEAALRRLDTEDYGICARCRQPIPIERLRAVPWAERCVECQAQVEIVRERRRDQEKGDSWQVKEFFLLPEM